MSIVSTATGRARSGTHPALEEEANELLFGSLKLVTSHEAKSDILTPWKERDRQLREVMASAGTVDPSIRAGLYKRRANTSHPHLNSRDGATSAQRHTGTDPVADYEGYEGLLNII
jgi:hypothetical protein